LEEIPLVRQLAVELEQSLLVWRQFLSHVVRMKQQTKIGFAGRETYADIDLVLLVRIHGCGK